MYKWLDSIYKCLSGVVLKASLRSRPVKDLQPRRSTLRSLLRYYFNKTQSKCAGTAPVSVPTEVGYLAVSTCTLVFGD